MSYNWTKIDGQTLAAADMEGVESGINFARNVCTSSTRPGSVEGQLIYETDTNRELFYDGSGWVILAEPAQTWTPTTTNVTIGNGTITGEYHRSDGYCDFAIQLSFGSTTAFTSTVGFNLPFTAGGPGGANGMVGNCLLYDASVGLKLGFVLINGTTALNPVYLGDLVGTYFAINATSPFTWTTNDGMWVKGRYRMANRYS